MKKRIKSVDKLAKDSPREASKYMALRAKQYAPRQTGKLASSIRRRKNKSDSWSVLGGYSRGTFNVGRWSNREFSINVVNTNRYFKGGQTFKYGEPALSPGGKQVAWTAMKTPFWSKAVEETAKKFKKDAIRGFRKALRG